MTDEIDIINMSAGLDHAADENKDCTSDGAECFASQKLVEAVADDTLIVAAAGDEIQTGDLCCPGNCEGVLSGAGVLAKCTAGEDSQDINVGTPNQRVRPPNACWVVSNNEKHVAETLCTDRGCAPSFSCSDNRRYEAWGENHDPGAHSPDILGPIALVQKLESEQPALIGGTSYCPPFVTSQVANTLSTLREFNKYPDPSTIIRGVKESGKPVFDSTIPMLSGQSLGSWFGDRYGLNFTSEESESDSAPSMDTNRSEYGL